MRCGFCERIKKLRAFDVFLIIIVCICMYIANHFQIKEYTEQREQARQISNEREHKELEIYEDLQRKCYFKQDKNACEALKQY